MGNAVLLEPGVGAIVVNESDVADSDVLDALNDQHNPLLRALSAWSMQTQASFESNGATGRRAGGLLERDRYVTPKKIFDQIEVAREAAESDDVVSGVLETTESLAFSKMSFFADDPDEQDVWNQIAGDIDLDSRMRELWRELFIASQVYAACWWGERSYKVRGKTEKGNARKREFRNLTVPIAITILDPLKVTPVGNPIFNNEQLAYIADRSEAGSFDRSIGNRMGMDPVVERLIVSKYEPDAAEKKKLQEDGVNPSNLYLLNPANCFRHTATRPQYKRFAEVRMKSIFELLDLKHQLRQMDRAHLLGATHFIVLVKKGSDQHPAKPEEIANLQANVRTVARVPVIVGDHRLSVEIVTPKTDQTLRPERYNTVDSRITARLYQIFLLGNYAAGSGKDDSMTLTRAVASGMEARRHMLKRTLEAKVLRPTYLRNDDFSSMPKLRFHPKKIALDFDANFASFLMDLREIGDLSRESMLSQFDFDQEHEALLRTREIERFDEIFQTTVPGTPARTNGNGATNAEKKSAGRRQGGTRNGGGAAPGSGQGKAPRNVRKQSDGSQEKKATAAADEDEP